MIVMPGRSEASSTLYCSAMRFTTVRIHMQLLISLVACRTKNCCPISIDIKKWQSVADMV